MSTPRFLAATPTRTQLPLPWIAPAAPTLRATSRVLLHAYTFQCCFPTTSGAVIGGNATGGGSPQYAFVAAFDPTGSQLLYSTLFGDLNGFKCANGCGGYLGHRGRRGCQRLLLPGRRYPGRQAADHRSASFSPPALLWILRELCAGLSRLHRQVQSGHFRRWSIAGLLPPTLAGKPAIPATIISGIAIDSASNAYVVGYTNSQDFPVTSGAYGTVCGPNGRTCAAAHVTKLNPTGTAILWSTYVGDAKSDGSDAVFFTGPIQLDGKGNVYIMGQAGTSFPMVNPVEPTRTGGSHGRWSSPNSTPRARTCCSPPRIGSGGLDAATSSRAGRRLRRQYLRRRQ